MANKRKLLGCKVPQPAAQVVEDCKPAVCDRRPGHKGPHRHRNYSRGVIVETCCDKKCKTKWDMRITHGAPQEFWESLLNAQADGLITMIEAEKALRKYRIIYDAAPEK